MHRRKQEFPPDHRGRYGRDDAQWTNRGGHRSEYPRDTRYHQHGGDHRPKRQLPQDDSHGWRQKFPRRDTGSQAHIVSAKIPTNWTTSKQLSTFANSFQISLKTDGQMTIYSVRALKDNEAVDAASKAKIIKEGMKTLGIENYFRLGDHIIVFGSCPAAVDDIHVNVDDELCTFELKYWSEINPSTLVQPDKYSVISYFVSSVLRQVWNAIRLRKVGKLQYLSDRREQNLKLQGWDINCTLTSKAGLLLLVDAHSSDLDSETVQSILYKRISQQEKTQLLQNRLCYTSYTHQFYRIDHVTGAGDVPVEYARDSTFKKFVDGEEVTLTVEQYLQTKYNVTLRDRDSPIVALRFLRKQVNSNGEERLVKIPAELLNLLSNKPPGVGAMRVIKGPKEKLAELSSFRSLLDTEEVNEILAKYHLQISELPYDAHEWTEMLKSDKSIAWSQSSKVPLGRDFTMPMLTSYSMHEEVTVGTDWLLISVLENEKANHRAQMDIESSIKNLPIKMAYPPVFSSSKQVATLFYKSGEMLNYSVKNELRKKIMQIIQSNIIKVIVAILPGKAAQPGSVDPTEPIYRDLKQLGLELDIPTQCVKSGTLEKFQSKCWSKLYCALQAKIWHGNQSGIPWILKDAEGRAEAKFFEEKIKTIAIATRILPGKTLGIAMAANSNDAHTRVILATATASLVHSQIIMDLEKSFATLWERLKNYSFPKNQRRMLVPPSTLLIYRSGISEGLFNLAKEYEVAGIRRCIEKDLGKIELRNRRELQITRRKSSIMRDAKYYIKFKDAAVPAAVTREAQVDCSSPDFDVYKCALLPNDNPVISDSALMIEVNYTIKDGIDVQINQNNSLKVVLENGWIEKNDCAWVREVSEIYFEKLFLHVKYVNRTGDEKHVEIPLENCDTTPSLTLKFPDSADYKGATNFEFTVIKLGLCRTLKLIFIVTGKNEMRFIQVSNQNFSVPERGTYIKDGMTRVLKSGGVVEEFHLFCADPKRGTPAPVIYQIILNETNLSRKFIAEVTFSLCHLYYNWAGTVKKPNVLKLAQRLVEQLNMYIAENDRDGAERETACRLRVDKLQNMSTALMRTSLPL